MADIPIGEVLSGLNLAKYEEQFITCGFDSLEILLLVKDKDILFRKNSGGPEMAYGHALKLFDFIEKQREKTGQPPIIQTSLEEKKSKLAIGTTFTDKDEIVVACYAVNAVLGRDYTVFKRQANTLVLICPDRTCPFRIRAYRKAKDQHLTITISRLDHECSGRVMRKNVKASIVMSASPSMASITGKTVKGFMENAKKQGVNLKISQAKNILAKKKLDELKVNSHHSNDVDDNNNNEENNSNNNNNNLTPHEIPPNTNNNYGGTDFSDPSHINDKDNDNDNCNNNNNNINNIPKFTEINNEEINSTNNDNTNNNNNKNDNNNNPHHLNHPNHGAHNLYSYNPHGPHMHGTPHGDGYYHM